MEIFKRNIDKKYKIVEVSGNPKDIRKYLDINKLCDLDTIKFICKKYKTLFVIREVTTYDNLFGIRKTVESPFIPKFYDDADTIINTLKNLGLDYNKTFHSLSTVDKHVNSFYSDRYINVYAFTTREEAHKALEAYFRDIEKKIADEIAEQELNNKVFKVHSEEILI